MNTQHFSTLALALVRTLMPQLHLLDALYPASSFMHSGSPVELCLFPETLPDEMADLYTGFRQAGGTRPILSFAEALPATRVAAAAANTPLLVVMDAANGPQAAGLLAQHKAPPLLLAGDAAPALPPLYAAGYAGHCVVTLVQGTHEENFCFLSPSQNTAALVQAFETAGKAVAADLRLIAPDPEAAPDTVVIYLSADYHTWTNTNVKPLALVHDGSRPPEGNSDYSWLWYANRNQLRMLLGPVEQRYRRLRVIVPNALSTADLRAARLLLNGEVVRPGVEIWSEASGALSADLPPKMTGPLILGLWVPEGKLTDDGMTRLFACVDCVELSA